MQSGVTDVATARSIARKLFASYTSASSLDRSVMEKMLIDTYKIMNKEFRPTPQDVNLYGTILDTNLDGRVTLEDLEMLAVRFLARQQTRTYTKTVRERLQVARRLFQKFDKDHSGYLSENEIPALLIETYAMLDKKFNPTKQDIDSWMSMADLDGDGKVNLQDYERLILASLQKCGIRIYQKQ